MPKKSDRSVRSAVSDRSTKNVQRYHHPYQPDVPVEITREAKGVCEVTFEQGGHRLTGSFPKKMLKTWSGD